MADMVRISSLHRRHDDAQDPASGAVSRRPAAAVEATAALVAAALDALERDDPEPAEPLPRKALGPHCRQCREPCRMKALICTQCGLAAPTGRWSRARGWRAL